MITGWEYKRFTEVCDVTYGYAFDSKCFTDNPEDTPLIRIRDVKRGFSETFYNGEIPDGYKVMEGDYLVGMDGEFNIGQWGKRPGVLNQRVCKMNSSSSELINQYMYYFMKVCLKSIEDETPFVTVKHLSAKRINQIQIPLPPLSTQLAIVSELDKINELIRLKKEQLKDFDNLAQSLFYEMFGDPVENEKGWEVKKLNDICDVRDGTHDSPKYLQNSEYILITSKNIVNGSIDFENVNYISEEDYIKINKRSKVDNGDIIMPMIGTIGNPIIAHIDGTHKFCIKNVALIKFLADSTVNNMFIVNLMRCSSFSSYLLNQNKGGTQKFVALGAIRKLPIPLPPLSLQRLFAQRIEQIEREKSEVQKSIQDLETLLASRMQYWFE